ncbi:ABC transporter permease [Roseicyclus mahoneyensis]|uniref:Iron(III) transport system permease protein n=1 Tax=Roseicyclus mahoneyensis TaxID=164332 RepID=A0A316GAL9_9RHOB|nr:iron ABC transporter permease [Roseicyclus mahoneyensis]PWK57954.1 iron(III) transport system permease protein [Roseicyclus mahoneyensis]
MSLAALALFAVALMLVPLGLMLRQGLLVDGLPSLAPLQGALGNRSVARALWNSLDSAAVSATLSLGLGAGLALVVGLTNLRGKAVFTFLILIPMMIPPHVTAIAWTQALGPSSPLLGAVGLAPPLGSPHPLYGRGGVIALLAVQHMPLVFLVVLAALRALPREMAEAARVSGAGTARLLAKIILPLLVPSLLAAYALAFVSALGNFGIPALLGIPGRYTTLPVLIWQRLSSFGPSMLADVAVMSALMALIAIALVLVQTWLSARSRAALIGPPQPPMRLDLGRARPLAEAGIGLMVLVILGLPMAALVGTALVPTYGVTLTLETLTLANFEQVLFRQSVTARAFVNSTLAAGVAALALAGLGALLARATSGPPGPGRGIGRVVSTLAETTYAIPGIVISIAFILTFLRPLPLVGVSVYNTLTLIVLAYLCAFFAVALKPVSAACLQLDPALDEAARVAGAGWSLRMRRIFLPLVAPAAAAGGMLVFLTAYNEITVSALLWSSGTETIGTVIYNYENGGYTVLAAAMSTVTVVATVVLMALLDLLGRRMPPGVVPWRL